MGGIGGGKCLLEKPVLKVRMCLTSWFCLISRENPVFKAKMMTIFFYERIGLTSWFCHKSSTLATF